MIRNSLLLSAMAFALLLNGLAIAQDSPVEESADKPTVSEPVKADNDAADVVDQMMKKMKQQQPVVEPTERPSASATEKRPALSPSPKIDLDPKILGIAPGMPKPKLRREGEFVVNRQGRLLRSNDGQHTGFAY
ncbi:MAG TPA: hypothetical protein DCM28_13800, partial [Phycisphaerales bacterium]|nr:hypothetical protein [Phycisphaerales bacterium]